MKTRMIIYAEDGHVLANGEIYGTQIFLADGVNAEDFYEITVEEYQKILDEQEKKRPI
jgi:hypothetical protein